MIRGLALRSLCSLRLDTIVEYSTAPLKVGGWELGFRAAMHKGGTATIERVARRNGF